MESDENFGELLRQWCGLFITVHDKRVYFLHQTAREFLLPVAVCLSDPTITRTWAHTLDICQAHAVLAESCTVYLSLRTKKDVVTELLDYSAENWASHFREANVENTALISLALRICNPNSTHYTAWSEIYRARHFLPQNATNLILASFFGHKRVVQILLDTGEVDVNTKDKYGQTPLSWAARQGHEAVVRILLDTNKVDVDSKDRFGQTPLSFAAGRGYETVVRMLLDTGKIDINSKNKYGRTPLSFAAEKGHETVVRMLLNTDKIDVDSKDQYGQTPLSYAAKNGHEAVIEALASSNRP
ncbi:uncharacterized protein PgNI_00723 [Pyricularia grisea]|uniref:Uncharacterized protein n=1 Tax=Pyricularia grisea TaxID=148305 RepID=A0A6P8BKG1_PYRGI|nr:uncharacterized protein PgNI_00723 [Pyricularia grisea]TLD17067.1 hypothetical protein PgNI_00723 [Pyricularia grisea]